MKNHWVLRLMALMLALMLAIPAVALAEDEEIITEMVEDIVPVEGEIDLGVPEFVPVIEEIVEVPAEAPAEGEVVEAPVEEIAEAPAEAPEAAVEEIEEIPVEEIAEVPAEEIVEQPLEAPVEEIVEAPAAEEIAADADVAEYDAAKLMAAETAPTPRNYTVDTPISKNTKWTLNIGDTLQLTMAKTVKSFKSSKKSVATVTAAGLVTAKKAGKAKITATISKKKKIVVTVTVKDPYKPTSVSISSPSGSTFIIGMGNPQLTANLTPGYARTTLKWKSSNKKVCKVSATGVLTPVKAGKAKITVTTGNKKKASIKVTIKKNIVNGLNAKPSKALIKSVGKNWTIGPKSVERTASGKYVCKFWIINGLGKSKRINNLGMDLYVNDVKVASKTWSKINVVCGKGKTKLFKVTYGTGDLVVKNALNLTGVAKDKVYFALTSTPTLTYRVS